MRRLVIFTMGMALFTGCFAASQTEVKTEQDEWLSGQNEIILKQLADKFDDNWFSGQNKILLEQLADQLESIDNG